MTLNPADRLIVALDVPNEVAVSLVAQLIQRLNVTFFKLSASNLLDPWDWRELVRMIRNNCGRVMLDLKVRDNPDSVTRIVCSAFDAGATYVTVSAELAVVNSALRGLSDDFPPRPHPEQLILPVGPLTSELHSERTLGNLITPCGGAVVPFVYLRLLRASYPDAVLVTPGVRLPDDPAHDHELSHGLITPAEAIRAGATQVVVGRPITLAADPVAAARRYLEDLS